MVEMKAQEKAETDLSESELKAQLLVEILARVTSIENLLLAKGIVSDQDLADSFYSTAKVLIETLTTQASNQSVLDK
jgi:hypothetical protein